LPLAPDHLTEKLRTLKVAASVIDGPTPRVDPVGPYEHCWHVGTGTKNRVSKHGNIMVVGHNRYLDPGVLLPESETLHILESTYVYGR
jgi:hypothetical protein